MSSAGIEPVGMINNKKTNLSVTLTLWCCRRHLHCARSYIWDRRRSTLNSINIIFFFSLGQILDRTRDIALKIIGGNLPPPTIDPCCKIYNLLNKLCPSLSVRCNSFLAYNRKQNRKCNFS